MDFISEQGRIYAENDNGEVIAEITYTVNDGIATINHTFTDESLRGQGIAGKLVQAAAEQILDRGYGLRATCSYAVSWLNRHPEYKQR